MAKRLLISFFLAAVLVNAVAGVIKTESENEMNVTVVNRTCISEPDVPEKFILPPGLCKARNDSCKHEVVKLSDGTEIMCDTVTDGGGWLTFQRRMGKSSDFKGDWNDFLSGFGDIYKTFWFGLEKVHQLCPPKMPCEMRIDIVSDKGQEMFATYDTFSLAGGFANYKLEAKNFSGQGDIMGSANGAEFTSRNGPGSKELTKCLEPNGNGWWYQQECNATSLNGKMKMEYTEMKIRRRVVQSSTVVESKSGATILLRRVDGIQDFDKDWAAYRNGFGDCKDGDCWLGLKALHNLCAKNCTLEITMSYKGSNYYADYTTFKIGPESDNYRMTVSGYNGNVTEDDMAYHNNMEFTTKDADHDKNYGRNCAVRCSGGWWYNTCQIVQLTGTWGSYSSYKGITWKSLTGSKESLSSATMKVTPTDRP